MFGFMLAPAQMALSVGAMFVPPPIAVAMEVVNIGLDAATMVAGGIPARQITAQVAKRVVTGVLPAAIPGGKIAKAAAKSKLATQAVKASPALAEGVMDATVALAEGKGIKKAVVKAGTTVACKAASSVIPSTVTKKVGDAAGKHIGEAVKSGAGKAAVHTLQNQAKSNGKFVEKLVNVAVSTTTKGATAFVDGKNPVAAMATAAATGVAGGAIADKVAEGATQKLGESYAKTIGEALADGDGKAAHFLKNQAAAAGNRLNSKVGDAVEKVLTGCQKEE